MARRVEIIKEMKRLDFIFQKGRLAQDAYDRQIDTLTAEVAKIEAALNVKPSDTELILSGLVDAWNLSANDRTARARVLKSLLRQVVIDSDSCNVQGWIPNDEFALQFANNNAMVSP